ncbi:MAG TPA: sigma-70 family RNA polymerase sigma factor [Trebonia sp.]|nr:sigma-70 family RNA polymerase sigma factor [Trebonia sp.]
MRQTELSAAYDRYADSLYAYARFLLREPADAVDALEATFLVAAAPEAGPADPAALRAWLYALARNECLRLITAGEAASALHAGHDDSAHDDSAHDDTAHDDTAHDDTADGDADRALLRAALRGLTPADRDIIGMVWHGLEVAEIAAVLGVPSDDALTLFSLARDRLERSAVALHTARAARPDCAALRSRLGNWDGHLTVPLVRRIGQHVQHCAVCSARQRQELRPATLLSLTPGALLGAAVTAETARRAAATTGVIRDQVLDAGYDAGPEATAARETAARHKGAFRKDGFPAARPAGSSGSGGSRRRRAVAGLSVAAAVAVIAVIASLGAGQHARTAAGGGQAGLTGDSSGAPAAGTGGPPAAGTPSQTATGAPRRPARPSAAADPSAPDSPAATYAAAPPPAATAPAVPAGAPPGSPATRPAKPTTPPPARATISVPSSVQMWPSRWGWVGMFTVTVRGGSLSWSIANPNRDLRLSRTSGTSSASVAIGGSGRGGFAPLTVRAGGKTYPARLITSGGGGTRRGRGGGGGGRRR